MGTHDFFRSRLDQMVDLRHPLAVLSTRLPWNSIEAAVAPKLARQVRPAKRVSLTWPAALKANSAAASARLAACACPSV